MIGNSGINSYGTHSHGHNVTKCLHQTYDTKLKSGGSMPGAAGLQAGTGAKAQERFSVTDLLSGGWGNFLVRSASLFGRIWGNGQAGRGYGDSGKNGVWSAAGRDTAGIAADTAAGASAARQADAMGRAAAAGQVNGTERVSAAVQMNAAEHTAAAALTESGAVTAAAAVRLQSGTKSETSDIAGAGRKAVPETESLMQNSTDSRGSMSDGRFWKRQDEAGKAGKFFRRFGKTAVVIGKQFLGEREEKEAGASGEKEPEDLLAGDSSYLLDSYNRLGEYSTLAKGQGLEGRFRTLA